MVVTVNDFRRNRGFDVGKTLYLNQGSRFRGNIKILNVLHTAAVSKVRLNNYLVNLAAERDVVDIARAEIVLQRFKKIGNRNIIRLQLGTVDVQINMRRIGRKGGKGIRQIRRGIQAAEKLTHDPI